MAGGFSKDGAVQEQIDATIDDAVSSVRRQLPTGPSRSHCDECDAPIPAARQRAVPGVRYCVRCQSEFDANAESAALYNRRGSKDSQLR